MGVLRVAFRDCNCILSDKQIKGAYPLGFFSSRFFCSAHAFAPSRSERTTGKSETFINRASPSYERLIKPPPPLEEEVLSRSKES